MARAQFIGRGTVLVSRSAFSIAPERYKQQREYKPESSSKRKATIFSDLRKLRVQGHASRMSEDFPEIASTLAEIAKGFHARGWLLGTSGNLSAVVQREPLRLAMSPSGVDKGELKPDQMLTIDEQARIVNRDSGKPSDESLLHIRVVQERGAGAVLHTHSVWNTILSDLYASDGGVTITGYEMLKGLQGVNTHEHSEWLPIVDNSQDMTRLADSISQTLNEHKNAHGFLLRRHGLYSWGETLAQAKRHVEILEFLLETMGRTLHLRNVV